MSQARAFERKALSVLLAVLMCLSFVTLDVTGILGSSQKAQAYEANPSHTYYFTIKQGSVDSGYDGREGETTFRVWGKNADGTGTETKIYDSSISGCWAFASGSTGRGDASTGSFSSSYFPTRVYVGIDICDTNSVAGSKSISSSVVMHVWNNETNGWSDYTVHTFSFSSSTNFWGSGSSWKETTSSNFTTGQPSAASVKGSDVSKTINKTGDGNVTVGVNAKVYDQYGVIWKAAPTGWEIINKQGYTMSMDTGAGEDKTVTIGATNQTVGKKGAVVRAKYNSLYKDITVNITPTYKINFNTTTNGGTTSAPAAQGVVATGTTASWMIPNNNTYKPEKKNTATGDWEFVGWSGSASNTTSGVVAPGSAITIDNYNDTLYAIFKKTVTANFYYFNSSGVRQTKTSSPTAYNTETTVSFTVPNSEANTSFTLNGLTYTFLGWKVDDSAAGANTVGKVTSHTQAIRNAAYNYYAVYSTKVSVAYDTNSIAPARSATPSSIAKQEATQYLVASAANASGANKEAKSFTLSTTAPTRVGMQSFLGWRVYDTNGLTVSSAMRESEEATGLVQPGATVSYDQSKTLLAVYKDQRHTVTAKDFDGTVIPANGQETQTIRYDYDAVAPVLNTDPTQAVALGRYDDVNHYVFDKWTRAWNNNTQNPLFQHITKDEVIFAKYRGIAHSFELVTSEPVVKPTCTEPGVKTEICTVCGYVHTVVIPALGHDFTDLEGYKAPTCTKEGYYGTMRCAVCGVIDETYPQDEEGNTLESKVIPALGHKAAAYTGEGEDKKPVKDGSVAPSCVSKGYDYYICVQCGQEIKIAGSETDPIEHQTIETVPAVAATCTEAGLSEYTKCKDCGQIVVKPTTIPALGHDLVKHAKVEATCAEGGKDGAKAYATCSRCGKAFFTTDAGSITSEITGADAQVTEAEIAAAIKIAAPAHEWVTVEAAPATCTKAGHTGGTVCKNCGEPQEGSSAVETEPAKGHDWVKDDSKSFTSEAPCKEQSYSYYACSRCDATKIEYEDLAEHTWVDVAETPATCYQIGKTAHQQCTVCGTESEYTFTPKLNHNYVVTAPAVAATCTVDGLTAAYKCTNEGCDSVIAAAVVPATGHSFSAWTETVAATCTEAGEMMRHCVLNCGEEGAVETKEVAALGHDYVTVEAVAPTCTKAGNTAGTTCTRCGDTNGTEYAVLPKLGHSMVEVERKDATCAAAGYVKTECERCDHAEVEILDQLTEHPADKIVTVPAIPATCTSVGYSAGSYCSVCNTVIEEQVLQAKLPHTRKIIDAVPATCTEPGFTGAVVCEVCGEELQAGEAIPATGHKFTGSEWVTVSATCTTAGYRSRACMNGCGESEVVELPATGHDWVIDKAVAATCTSTGLTEGRHCSKCDAKIAQQVIDMLGHDEVITVVAPTCTDKGYTLKTCTRCDLREKSEETDALGHTGGEATCLAKAVCERCGKSYGKLADHRWEEAEDRRVDSTCIEKGHRVLVCAVCGEEKTETLDFGSHTYDYSKVEVVDATCTQGGYVHAYCEVCGELYEETEPALGHDVTNWRQEGGVAYGTCNRCGEEVTAAPSAVGLKAEKCEKCGLIHEGRTGIFVYNGLYCRIVGFFRSIIKLFKR